MVDAVPTERLSSPELLGQQPCACRCWLGVVLCCAVLCHLLLQFGFQSRSLKAVYYLQKAGITQVCVDTQGKGKDSTGLFVPAPDLCCCRCVQYAYSWGPASLLTH
jgi:hypothetical protein